MKMRVIEVNMEYRRDEGAGQTGDPLENPPTNGITPHDSHLLKSGDPTSATETIPPQKKSLKSFFHSNDFPEKTRRPAALSGTIPTCETSGVARLGIEPGFALVGGEQSDRSATALPQRPVGYSGELLDSHSRGPELSRSGSPDFCLPFLTTGYG
ncbi:hypothetical protein PR048_007716 [Dryococelus australis]|uniref:Uncharacterized protein n=1 Tax=Dryococelus australis TaxID=614101 RepID=A0ABQ9HV17_9NEOP|nr:hypothetical protein PR048_007716 [Dryococelus australis]